jgi:branched-chain amino acid transport system permease protein
VLKRDWRKFKMEYLIHILIMIGIYMVLIYSLNLLIGYSGLLSLCHAAFYGIGAYAFTLLSIKLNLSFFYALFFSIIITGIIAFLVGIPATRLRGDMFVLVTIGFQIIIFTILYNSIPITRGPYGIPGIPRPFLSFLPFRSKIGIEIEELPEYLFLIFITDLIFVFLLFIIYKSPFGLALKSLREDERAAQALGKASYKYFLYSFIIAGSFSSISGSLYASYITYIDPTSFTLSESFFQVAILLLGGSGNIKGPFFGLIFMIIFPEILRFLGLPDTIAPNVRQIIYGFSLLILMFVRPKGFFGEYEIK